MNTLRKEWVKGIGLNRLHSLPPKDVEANSPAALAGFQAYTDYIVGADQVLQDVRAILLDLQTMRFLFYPSFQHT